MILLNTQILVYEEKAITYGIKKDHRIFTVIVTFLACVNPYAVQILSSKSYLFVEGSITNNAKQNPIRIVRTDASAVFESLEFSSTIVGDIRNEYIPLRESFQSTRISGDYE
ncbi:MAG: hypothetical protein ACI9V1_001259 [Spirosomataceae bacterium]